MKKQKKSKSQLPQERPLQSSELKWIESVDGRLMPLDVLRQSENRELTPERYYNTAEMLIGNPLVFYLYGLDEQGIIKAGIFGHYNPMDNCIYLEVFFNVFPKEKSIVPLLQSMKKNFGADKVKVIRPKVLEIGG